MQKATPLAQKKTEPKKLRQKERNTREPMRGISGGGGVLGDCGRGKQAKNTKACEMGMSVSQSVTQTTDRPH